MLPVGESERGVRLIVVTPLQGSRVASRMSCAAWSAVSASRCTLDARVSKSIVRFPNCVTARRACSASWRRAAAVGKGSEIGLGSDLLTSGRCSSFRTR